MTKHRIALIDSYRLMVEALAAALETQEDLEVTCRIFSADDQETVCHTQLDLIIMGSNLSNFGELGNQSELIPQVRKCAPAVPILLIVRAENSLQDLALSLQSGASGAVTTSSSLQEMLDAIHDILHGGEYLPYGLGRRLIQNQTKEQLPGITLREVSILRGLAFGHTNQEIADTMKLSVRTVEVNRAAIQSKLDLHSRAEIVQYALQQGIMEGSTEWVG